MKILLISYFYLPNQSPQAIQMSRWIKYSRHEFTVVCSTAAGPIDPFLLGATEHTFTRLTVAPRLVDYPDRYANWARVISAGSDLADLAAQHDVVVTSGTPMSVHLAGLRLKNVVGMPWLAHFSDPWTRNPLKPSTEVLAPFLAALEARVIAASDSVVFTSDYTAQRYRQTYPQHACKVSSIGHAYDPELTPLQLGAAHESPEIHSLRYFGAFYGRRNPNETLRALRDVLQASAVSSQTTLELFGTMRGGRLPHFSRARRLIDVPWATHRGSLEYSESVRRMLSSGANLVIDADMSDSPYFPSKLADYYGAGRPVIAITPPGQTADLISQYGGHSVILRHGRIPRNDLAAAINAAAKSHSSQPPPPELSAKYIGRRLDLACHEAG